MSRVELTQNFGPEVVTSWDDVVSASAADNYGKVVDVRLYTLHSYQVIHAASGSPTTFSILGSNYTDPATREASADFDAHWTKLHSEVVASGSSIIYSDIWNFKYSVIHFEGASAANVKVLEKHNV